jgi:hypothetical protein
MARKKPSRERRGGFNPRVIFDLESIVFFVTRTVGRTLSRADILIIRAHDVLSQVAPAVLTSLFIGVIWISQLTRDVDRLTSQMDARRMFDRSWFVVVLGKGHN